MVAHQNLAVPILYRLNYWYNETNNTLIIAECYCFKISDQNNW